MAAAPNLFNDPALKEQFNSLPEEEKKKYKQAGEHMYSKDYTSLGSQESNMREALEYIKMGLRSGMLPKHLTADERELLRTMVGPEWYREYGHTSVDE